MSLVDARGGGDRRDGGGELARHCFVRRGVRRRLVAADALRGEVTPDSKGRAAGEAEVGGAAILAAYAPFPHLVLRALRVVVVVVVAIVAVVVAVSPRAMFGRVGT